MYTFFLVDNYYTISVSLTNFPVSINDCFCYLVYTTCIDQEYVSFLSHCVPLWVRGCRIGPTYPPACRKRRLIGGSLFAVGCDPCQWKRGSWLLSQYFVAALRRQYTALASISLSRKVKMAWLNQSAGSAKP